MTEEEPTGIHCRLDELLEERGMTLTRLGELVGVSIVNLSILKNGHAKAVRFSTLSRICQELDCQPGDLLRYSDLTGSGQAPSSLPTNSDR